jgi:hypothetical protein
MDRKELLIRKNEGRRKIQGYIFQLNRILKTDLHEDDFLDLETSDHVKNAFYDSFKNSTSRKTKTYRETETVRLENDIKELRERFIGLSLYLITNLSEYCGVVTVPAVLALDNYRELIELDGDSLNLADNSIGGSNNFLLDYYEEKSNYYFELSVW